MSKYRTNTDSSTRACGRLEVLAPLGVARLLFIALFPLAGVVYESQLCKAPPPGDSGHCQKKKKNKNTVSISPTGVSVHTRYGREAVSG